MKTLVVLLFGLITCSAVSGFIVRGAFIEHPKPYTVEYTNCYVGDEEMIPVNEILMKITNINQAPPLPVRKP